MSNDKIEEVNQPEPPKGKRRKQFLQILKEEKEVRIENLKKTITDAQGELQELLQKYKSIRESSAPHIQEAIDAFGKSLEEFPQALKEIEDAKVAFQKPDPGNVMAGPAFLKRVQSKLEKAIKCAENVEMSI